MPKTNQYSINIFNRWMMSLLSKDIMRPLCIGLLNIIFKVRFERLIADRSRYSEEFAFTLITGSGDYKDNGIQIQNLPSVIPEANSTTSLTGIKYQIQTQYTKKNRKTKQCFEQNSTGVKIAV